MRKNTVAILGTAVLGLVIAADANLAQRSPAPAGAGQTSASAEPQGAILSQYCMGCHSDTARRGGLTLAGFDASQPEQNVEVAEKIIRKLRAGMMPPPGARRPDHGAIKQLVAAMENRIDQHAGTRPSPGRRTFQRLTRTEYASSVRELLDIEVDVTGLLPPDTVSDGFDNIADNQGFSPALLEGYMRAASKIVRDALGDPKADATSATFKVPRTGTQLRHLEGAPMGTRGGIVVTHNFPADGEYVFKMMMHGTPTGGLFGGRSFSGNENIEISVNGERAALIEIPANLSESSPNGLILTSPSILIKAGPQVIAAAFIQRTSLLVDDLIAPIEHSLADSNIGSAAEISTLPHLRDFEIAGPFKITGVSETPSRRKVFTCRPVSAAEEAPCATKIITDLARQAYRRPVTAEDMEGLTSFFEAGRADGDFESGIRTALQAILASPNFVFRFEQTPSNVRPGETYRIADLELASRLSYFLWTAAPDEELIALASQGKLREPATLEQQVRRMLADPRSETLATKFAYQWLQLGKLNELHPDALLYPQYDYTLGEGLKREVELFFDSIVREDRSLLDLLTADHTFVDERVAKLYGVPNVMGTTFRRVILPEDYRRGLLGKAAILAQESIADRTSPVRRGKWVMETILGSPPPPPPPAVPQLSETSSVSDDGKRLTVRKQMENHRNNPNCLSCHSMIDPIGLALENFDVTGEWRIRDRGALIDASTTMFDGSFVDGPVGLRQTILEKYPEAFIGNFTEKLMTYALGRRVEYHDMPMIRAITKEAARNNNRFSSFVLGIVKSPAFQMSVAETTAQE
jgi:mono/diheme cytochrome c family protein